jgi:hypothetical protein
MSPHERALTLAAAAIDFRLSPEEQHELAAHLAGCPSCSVAAAAMRADAAALARAPRLDAPASVRRAVMRAATSRSGGARPSPVLAFALIALVLAMVGGAFVGGSLLQRDDRTPQPSLLGYPDRSPSLEPRPPTTERPRPTPRPTPAASARPGRSAQPPTPASWRRLGDLGDAFGGKHVTSISAAPGGGFIAFGEDASTLSPLVWRSDDGVAWEAVDVPDGTFGGVAPVSHAELTDAGLVVVAYDVSVESGTRRVVWTSPDGRTWTKGAGLDTDGSPLTLISGPQGLLAWLTTGRVWSSADGVTWTRSSIGQGDVSDVLAGRDGFTAVGRDGARVWFATSANGRRWDFQRIPVDGDALPGAEAAATGPQLVWVGTDRWRPAADGGWSPTGARIPQVSHVRDVIGGPRGFLAIGFVAPGGAHRAWTWDGQGAWQAVEGSRAGSAEAGGAEVIGAVPDDTGWTVFAAANGRVTAWRVDP